jgi:hypothetical protein
VPPREEGREREREKKGRKEGRKGKKRKEGREGGREGKREEGRVGCLTSGWRACLYLKSHLVKCHFVFLCWGSHHIVPPIG